MRKTRRCPYPGSVSGGILDSQLKSFVGFPRRREFNYQSGSVFCEVPGKKFSFFPFGFTTSPGEGNLLEGQRRMDVQKHLALLIPNAPQPKSLGA